MGRVKKVFNKDGPFQTRLRELCAAKNLTQTELASSMDVSRPTLSGWLLGNNLPDIEALTKLAQYFNVSADYLLGLSDTLSPDVNLRAAAEYTGLSEGAVERLHIGVDNFECDGVGLSNVDRRNNQEMTSVLIQNEAFAEMIFRLLYVFNAAYVTRVMTILDERYLQVDDSDDDPDFHFASHEDRKNFLDNFVFLLSKHASPPIDDEDKAVLKELDDDGLAACLIHELISYKEKNELNQFHAAKAFSGFIDHVVRGAEDQANKDFKIK